MQKKLSKLLIILVLALTTMLAMATTANAEIVGSKAKGTVWEVNTDTGVLKIDVEGPMGSWTQGSQPWYKYRNYIKELQFASATSKITNYAFSDLVNLEKIEIPNSVEEIGDYAFLNCAGAKEVYIPISVANWGGFIFKDCVSIGYIFTENTTNINMTTPIWDSSVGSQAENGYVELQIESKSIGQYAFYGLSSVTNVKLPTTLTGINDYAFYGFTSPFALNLNSATNIGKYAFYGCTGVTVINLPVATTIGENAFYGCSGAESINLPVATSIGENAFKGCSGAKTIYLGATNITYGNNCFADTTGCTEIYLGSINFAQNSNALSRMGSGKTLTMTLGKSVSAINGTLQTSHIGTTGSINLVLEEGSNLNSVGASAFENNSILTSVDFSNSAKNVSYNAKAFNNCANLKTFSSNTGTATLTTLSFGNLKKLETLNWNASSTTLGWSTQLQAKVTFTSAATTASSHTGSHVSQQKSSTASMALTPSTTQNTSYGWYPTGDFTISAATAGTTSASQNSASSGTATSTTTASYNWVGTNNTGNHPFLNLGSSVSAGSTVTFGKTVTTVPDYFLTSGVYAFETAAATLKRTYTATGSSTASSTKSTSGTPATPAMALASVGGDVYFGYYASNLGWTVNSKKVSVTNVGNVAQSVTITSNLTDTTTVTQSCAITEGVKLSSATGIKLNQVNSISKAITSVGQSSFGWIQIPMTSANNDLPSAGVTSSFTASENSISATRNSTSTQGTIYTAPNFAVASRSYPYFAMYMGHAPHNSGYKTNWTWSNNWGAWHDNSYTWTQGAGNGSANYYGKGIYRESGLQLGGNYYCAFATKDMAIREMRRLFDTTAVTATTTNTISGTFKTNTISIPASTTTTKTWSTVNNAANVPVNGYPDGNNVKTANFGMAGNNMTINAGAFLGAKSLTNAYLASTVKNIQGNAFYTRNTGTSDILYAYGKSNVGDFSVHTGLDTHNDITAQYKPALKDYGIFVGEYKVGNNVTAYLYNTSGSNYLVNLAGSGATYDSYTASNRPGWAGSYGTKVTEVIIDDTVTSVGNYMFYGHSALQSVTFGTGVTKIGDYAFANCTSFENQDAAWPCPVTEFGSHAFANCSIKMAGIPSTILKLGSGVFAGNPVQQISYRAKAASAHTADIVSFSGLADNVETLVIIGNEVTSIPAFLFYKAEVEKITIGPAVASIGEGAFSGSKTAIITVADGNTAYKANADGNLYTADGLTMVTYLGRKQDAAYTLASGVNTIAAGAFYGHPYLERMTFDATVINVGKEAFFAAEKLESIAVNDFMDEASFLSEVTVGDNWSGSAEVIFSGLSWDIGVTKGAMTATLYSDGRLAITGSGYMKNWASANAVDWYSKRNTITKVTFDGDIQSIGAYAFSGCQNLADCVPPASVENIGQYAFFDCKALTFVRVPDKVKTISTYTFANCTALVWADCGLGVESIEPFAFSGCSNARYISINGSATEVKGNAFQGDKNATLLIVGKQQMTDFTDYTGIKDASTGSVDTKVFRICYLKDIETGRLMDRYAANNTTAAIGASGSYANTSDLYAYSFDSDNDGKSDYLHVAGASAMETTWADKTQVPWNAIRATLTKVCVEDDVTSVGPYAFEDCTALQFARIGKGAATFSTHAFYNCSSLKEFLCNVRSFSTGSLTADSNVFVGAGASDGFSVVFEDDATRIPGYLFYNCKNLTNLTFGKGISSINSFAFAGCTGLKTLYIKSTKIDSTDPKIFTDAGKDSGGFTVEIAANVTKIPDNLFYSTDGNPYCTSVFADAGSKLESIGSSAFFDCNRLESAYFANCSMLTYIHNAAFKGCTRLVSADFSNCIKLQKINSEAFANCMNLADFSINNDEAITNIGDKAFYNTLAIRTMTIPESVREIGADAFGLWVPQQIIYVLGKMSVGDFSSAPSSWPGNATVIYTNLSWDVSKKQDGSIIAYYTVPDPASINTEYCIFVVGEGEMIDFATQEGINWPRSSNNDVRSTVTRVYVGDGITRIGNYNFAGFDKCVEVQIGHDVQEIGKYAFRDDIKVPEFDLSSAKASLTNIDDGAFENCSGTSTVNLSGCSGLGAVGNDAFKNLADSSIVYVSTDYLYDMLANVNGNIKSTYGTTTKTKVVTVRVFFTKDLVSQGVYNGKDVVWNVEATSNDNLIFHWYYATTKGGQWTEITSAMTGYTINSTVRSSTLTMDGSIVTLDKNGYYFYCEAVSPYYEQASSTAALAVYSSAITPTITVIDRNGDALESNTWTQGPLTIIVTEGTADNGLTPTYQYKLKASGTWRNTEPKMTYNTEGIVTFYCRAIINNDPNTASAPVKYIIKVDNSSPTVSISADPEFESTESVDLTATANDQVSGVQSINWYKTAADANDSNTTSNVTGYVPLMDGVDMNTVDLSVRHIKGEGGKYTADTYTTTYVGKNETHSFNLNVDVDPTDAGVSNYVAATANTSLEKFELYEIHVMDATKTDYAISASNKGVVTIPVPTDYDTTRIVVYGFNRTGSMAPITNYTLNNAGDSVTFPVAYFGYFVVGLEPVSSAPTGG